MNKRTTVKSLAAVIFIALLCLFFIKWRSNQPTATSLGIESTPAAAITNQPMSIYTEKYNINGTVITNRTIMEDFEKKSFVARSRTKAVGCAGLAHDPFALAGGAITNNISLQDESLGFIDGASFGNIRPDHSGEFQKPVQNTTPFYRKLLSEGFLITPNP